jgi:hypothetical protein
VFTYTNLKLNDNAIDVLAQEYQAGHQVGMFLDLKQANRICIWASLGVDKQCQMTVFTQ